MKRLICRVWGHDTIVVRDLLIDATLGICLRCRERAYGATRIEGGA